MKRRSLIICFVVIVIALGFFVCNSQAGEVWVGLGPTTSGFFRYDFDGTYIDKINNSHYTTALAVVPEPSTVFLLALGAVMLRRKYQL